jgi:cell division protein FtsQ
MRLLSARREAPAAQRPRRLRRRPRRRARLAAGAVALTLVVGCGAWLQRSGALAAAATATEQRVVGWSAELGFALATVEVEGRERSEREAILAALAVSRGMPIFAIDPAAARSRLEAMPWIRSAAVERRLPGTLFISLTERQPFAVWQHRGKLELIDRDGTVIAGEKPDAFGSLVVLVGDDAPARGAALLDMLTGEPDLAKRVAAAVRVGGRRWTLRLDNAVDVALPEIDPESAWHRLAQLERSDGLLERAIQAVDLRLPDRLVVRTAGEPPKPSTKKSHQPGKTIL